MIKLIWIFCLFVSTTFAQVVAPFYVGGPPPPGTGIAQDNKTNTVTTTGLSSYTISHTVNSSSSTYMTVAISFISSSVTVTNVTYNGVDMGAALVSLKPVGNRLAAIYGLKAPASGTHDVVVNLSDARNICVSIQSWTGVNQSTSTGSAASNNGTSTGPTVSVTSSSGDMTIDCLTDGDNSTCPTLTGTFTPVDADQCEATDSFIKQGSQHTTTASPSMNWTSSQNTAWTIVAVPLKPA